MITADRVYFPNLNGLRFVAAFLVIIHHQELIKVWLGLPSLWGKVDSIFFIGKLGVVLFFVLSGFLITYLLLAEDKKTGTISVKKFYMRRILRIWPLYFIIVILAFFILPKVSFFDLYDTPGIYKHFWTYLTLYVFFLPNVVLSGFLQPIPYAAQAWSIGVEEQFYILCPIFMKYIKNKQRLLLLTILGYLFIKLLVFPLLHTLDCWNIYFQRFQNIWDTFNIDCMAIGGLFAIWLFNKKAILKYIYHPIMKWGTFVILCVSIGNGFNFPYVNFEVYAILFGILIMNLATNPIPTFNIENKVFSFLGKISYGLYMYHMIAIVISLKVLTLYNINNYLIQLFVSVLLTVIISAISYELIEKRFIKLKKKFSKITSGENAKD